MDDLKPCPFCGQIPELDRFEYGPPVQGLPDKEGQPFFRASCENSSCPSQPTGGFRDLCSDAITAWNTRDERELTALKLAATEQATQAEAVLKERTRERDALALSQGRLLGALKYVLEVREIRCTSHPKGDTLCAKCRADAAIAEATPEGDTR